MENKIGCTVKVKSGAYKGIEGILVNDDTIRPFDQDKSLSEEGYDITDNYGEIVIRNVFRLWHEDEYSIYSELGGIVSNSPIDSDCFYISTPVNPVTTLLYPDAETSSDGKFYYV